MASAPNVEFRSRTAPYAVISPPQFIQSALGGSNLPVLGGENSDIIYFRIYNNFGLAAGVASMTNVRVTVFGDPLAQAWLRIYETAFGEGPVTPGLATAFNGDDTAIGNSGTSKYTPEIGSSGSSTAQIRAGTDTNGCGFIEFAVYLEVPDGATFDTYPLTISVEYDWTP